MKFLLLVLLGLALAWLTPAALAAPDQDSKREGKHYKADKDQTEMLAAAKEAKSKRKKETKHNDDDGDRDRDHEEASKTKSNERAAEMMDRKAERKAIKDDYKASGVKQKGKKPWWKFWEGQEETPQGEYQ